MQKVTLFTLVLAFLVIVTVADFLVGKQLATSTIPVTENEIEAETEREPEVEVEAEPESEEISKPIPNEVSQFLNQRQFRLDSLNNADLDVVGFKNMKLEKTTFDQMIFQLLD